MERNGPENVKLWALDVKVEHVKLFQPCRSVDVNEWEANHRYLRLVAARWLWVARKRAWRLVSCNIHWELRLYITTWHDLYTPVYHSEQIHTSMYRNLSRHRTRKKILEQIRSVIQKVLIMRYKKQNTTLLAKKKWFTNWYCQLMTPVL